MECHLLTQQHSATAVMTAVAVALGQVTKRAFAQEALQGTGSSAFFSFMLKLLIAAEAFSDEGVLLPLIADWLPALWDFLTASLPAAKHMLTGQPPGSCPALIPLLQLLPAAWTFRQDLLQQAGSTSHETTPEYEGPPAMEVGLINTVRQGGVADDAAVNLNWMTGLMELGWCVSGRPALCQSWLDAVANVLHVTSPSVQLPQVRL